MLANPKFKGIKSKIAEEVGVTRQTLYRWLMEIGAFKME